MIQYLSLVEHLVELGEIAFLGRTTRRCLSSHSQRWNALLSLLLADAARPGLRARRWASAGARRVSGRRRVRRVLPVGARRKLLLSRLLALAAAAPAVALLVLQGFQAHPALEEPEDGQDDDASMMRSQAVEPSVPAKSACSIARPSAPSASGCSERQSL